MKKKIIFMVFCLVLFSIFASLSYGGPDPKYRLREHPNQELLSPPLPPHGDKFEDVLLVVIPNWNGYFLLLCTKNSSSKEKPALQTSTTQEVKCDANSNVKRAR